MEPSEVSRLSEIERERIAQILLEEELEALGHMQPKEMELISPGVPKTRKREQREEPEAAEAGPGQPEKLLVIDLHAIRAATEKAPKVTKKVKKAKQTELSRSLERGIGKTIRREQKVLSGARGVQGGQKGQRGQAVVLQRPMAPQPRLVPKLPPKLPGEAQNVVKKRAQVREKAVKPALTAPVMTSGMARRPISLSGSSRPNGPNGPGDYEGRGRVGRALLTATTKDSSKRPSLQPMDPEIERLQQQAEETAEKMEAEQKKRARMTAPPPPAPSLFGPSLLAESLPSRRAFQPGAAKPIKPPSRSEPSVTPLEVFRALKPLQESIIDMALLLHLNPNRSEDRVAVETQQSRDALLRFFDQAIFSASQLRIISDLLSKLSGSAKRAFEAQFKWLKDLANLHKYWVMLQLDVLKSMMSGSENLRCHRMEDFSDRFVRYSTELVRLFRDAPQISVEVNQAAGRRVIDLSSVLENYVTRIFGTHQILSLRPEEQVNRFVTLVNYVIGYDPNNRTKLFFSELLRADVNCDSDDQLRILTKLQSGLDNLLIIAGDDITIRFQLERSLLHIRDEISRRATEHELEAEEEFSYGDVPLDEVELEIFSEK